MSVSSLVGAIDDIARCSSVLAEGIEGGLLSDSLFFRIMILSFVLGLLSDKYRLIFMQCGNL